MNTSQPSTSEKSQVEVPTNSPAVSQSTAVIKTFPESVQSAEILHCLNLIENHSSYNSSRNSGALFRKMFPDSQIANDFQCLQ